MKLEKILKPAKYVDEQVLRLHTKLGKKIPEKNLYKLTAGLTLFGCGFGGVILPLPGAMAYGGLMGYTNLSLDMRGLNGDPPTYINGDTRVVDPFRESSINLTRKLRLPLLTLGAGFLGKAGYDIVNFFINGEPIDSETYKLATSGFGFISSASSMYLKDQDPKLLDKQPFWKTAYEKVKGKIKDLAPKPLPQPVPQPIRYSTLETNLD